MRNVTIFSTRGNRRNTIQSEATTWSELQDDLNNNDIEYSSFKAIVSSTQNTLESSEAVLPEGDFTLMLIPGKVKSGSDYEDMRYNDLRRLATQNGITGLNAPPTKIELIEALEEYDANEDVIEEEDDEEFEQLFDEVSEISTPTLNIEDDLTAIESAVSRIRVKVAGAVLSNDELGEVDEELLALQREAARIEANLN